MNLDYANLAVLIAAGIVIPLIASIWRTWTIVAITVQRITGLEEQVGELKAVVKEVPSRLSAIDTKLVMLMCQGQGAPQSCPYIRAQHLHQEDP